MKKIKIRFPYVTYVIKATFEDVENHPDKRVKENVIDAIGVRKYRHWRDLHNKGITKTIVMTNKIHIIKAFKDPFFIGNMIGLLFIASVVILLLVAAVNGAIEVIKFIGGLLW